MKNTTILAALATPLLAFSLTAQTPNHLVGFTRIAPNLRHVDHWNCTPLGQCFVPMPNAAALPPFAGGTAWDPVRSGAWVTNGILLAMVDDNCNMVCPPMPIPGIGPNALATGLEVVESQNQLLVLDSLGNLHTFTNTCPPNPINVCNTGLVPGPVQMSTSGIAVDEGQGIVFMSHCDFATGANFIAVSQLANPCNVLCRIPVQPCFAAFGAITGLACDWARQTLYATDGLNTMALRYGWNGQCVNFVNINCCVLPGPALDPMIGLAIRPGQATSVGVSCANGACPPCPMIHSLGNDPNLGNAFFHLDLAQAPSGSLAWCIIGTGPCSPAGALVPPLCGPIYAVPVLGTLGPNPTGGFGGCSGATSFAFPLPLAPGLAGWTMSSQCVALCATTTLIGTAVSNCLSFTLQGS